MTITLTLKEPALGLPAGTHTLSPQMLALKIGMSLGVSVTPEEAVQILVLLQMATAALEAIGGDPSDHQALVRMVLAIQDYAKDFDAPTSEAIAAARHWVKNLLPADWQDYIRGGEAGMQEQEQQVSRKQEVSYAVQF